MISSKKTNNKKQSATYPKLMTERKYGYTVLFYAHNKGVVVNQGGQKGLELGFHSSHWGMLNFEDFDGKITLENKS